MNRDLRIELIGLPGAGKTTLARNLSKRVPFPLKYELIAHGLGADAVNSYLKFFLRFHRFLGKPLRLYDSWAYQVIKGKPALQPELMNIFNSFNEFSSSEAQDSMQFPLIARALERDLVFNLICFREKKGYINDDGLIQRLLSIFGLRFNNWDTEKANNFQNSVIHSLKKGIVVYVTCSPDIAFSRLISRSAGTPELLKDNELREKFDRTLEYINFLLINLKKSGVQVLYVDAENSVDNSIEKIIRELRKF